MDEVPAADRTSSASVPAVTRGHGSLEAFLARRRANVANRLIPPEHRQGRILDVGCGCFPYFLAFTHFKERFGVDKMVSDQSPGHQLPGVNLLHFDVDQNDVLPFPDQHFQVVTMLAVFEHIRPDRLLLLLNEIHRVLAPGGVMIMTTPTGWTGPILDLLTRLGVVSAVEIAEHEDSYSKKMVMGVLASTRFAKGRLEHGYFELFMNQWVRGTR